MSCQGPAGEYLEYFACDVALEAAEDLAHERHRGAVKTLLRGTGYDVDTGSKARRIGGAKCPCTWTFTTRSTG
jgi:hypothetical protein